MNCRVRRWLAPTAAVALVAACLAVVPGRSVAKASAPRLVVFEEFSSYS
jgi:hypothetical protein